MFSKVEVSYDYDTEYGISTYLTSMEGLHKLRKLRYEAGYDRREKLNDWIILGRFYLDSCGNMGVLKFPAYSKESSNMLPSLKDVVSVNAIHKLFKDFDYSWGLGGAPILAPLNEKCSYCDKGWTVSTAHDVFSIEICGELGYAYKYYHLNCYKLHSEFESMKDYSSLCNEIGLTKTPIALIPNEYWNDPNDPYAIPWALIKTIAGNIKVGRRKRVINIDWSDLYKKRSDSLDSLNISYSEKCKALDMIDGEKLFPNENVTKSTTYIHAWDRFKAVEYLKKIGAAFSIGLNND